jgi:23S rRNA (cytosine1962-C5)-methyltransferase
MKNSSILIVESSIDYALLDSGDGEKLERFGEYILSRPDPQALWHKRLPVDDWKKADGFLLVVKTREIGL